MKNSTILAAIMMIICSVNAEAACKVKKVQSTGTISVYPIYTTSVNYTFDQYLKNAFSQVRWDYDRDATSLCVNKILSEDANAKIEILGPDMPTFEFTVKGGLKAGPMMFYAEQGGQFHGNTDLIPVDYKMKNELIKSINKKENLISVSTDLRFHIEGVKRDVISEFNCSKGSLKSGIVPLHSRFTQLMAMVKSFTSSQQVDTDSILGNFIENCVEIKEGEIRDFKGLGRKVSLRDSKLPIFGKQIYYSTELVSPVQSVELTYIEF